MKIIKDIICLFLFLNLSIAFSNNITESNSTYLKLFDSTGLPIPECMDISFDYSGQHIERINFDRNHHKLNPCKNEFAIEFISIAKSFRYGIKLSDIKNKQQVFNDDVDITIAENFHTQDSVSIFIKQKPNQNESDNLYIEMLIAGSRITHVEMGYCELLNLLFGQNKKLSRNILNDLNCVKKTE